MAVKWKVEQKEDKITLYFENDRETVEIPDITADEAEKLAETLTIAIFRAKQWQRENQPMKYLNDVVV